MFIFKKGMWCIKVEDTGLVLMKAWVTGEDLLNRQPLN